MAAGPGETIKHGYYTDFMCGWGAGCIETICLFPPNKIIFRQQLHGHTVRSAVGQMKTEGWSRLYRGLLPPLIMRTSSRALMFGLYDKFQTLLSCPHSPPNTSFTLCHASAAFLAGCMEATLCPLERVQVLLQTPRYHDEYKNTGQAFKLIRVYGVREYYRGFSVMVVRNSLSNSLFFSLREPFKQFVLSSGSALHPNVRHVVADFVSGAILGASISTLFFPINVVKNHIQSKVGTPYERPLDVFREVWKERNRSLRGLYLGVHLNFTRSLLAWGITNSVYELFRRTLSKYS